MGWSLVLSFKLKIQCSVFLGLVSSLGHARSGATRPLHNATVATEATHPLNPIDLKNLELSPEYKFVSWLADRACADTNLPERIALEAESLKLTKPEEKANYLRYRQNLNLIEKLRFLRNFSEQYSDLDEAKLKRSVEIKLQKMGDGIDSFSRNKISGALQNIVAPFYDPHLNGPYPSEVFSGLNDFIRSFEKEEKNKTLWHQPQKLGIYSLENQDAISMAQRFDHPLAVLALALNEPPYCAKLNQDPESRNFERRQADLLSPGQHEKIEVPPSPEKSLPAAPEAMVKPGSPLPAKFHLSPATREVVDAIVLKARENDGSCSRVNSGKPSGPEAASLSYTKFMAYGFVRNMCAPSSPELLSPPSQEKYVISPKYKNDHKALDGKMRDVLAMPEMKVLKVEAKNSTLNLASTFGFFYSAVKSESEGNPMEPHHGTGGIQMEAGMDQNSVDSLDDHPALGVLFKKYLMAVKESASNTDAFGNLCELENFDKEYFKGFDHWQRNESSYNPKANLQDLNRALSAKNKKKEVYSLIPTCIEAAEGPYQARLAKKPFTGWGALNACYRNMKWFCPAFARNYGLLMLRVNRGIHRPTWPENMQVIYGNQKRIPKPACTSMFYSLNEKKDEICRSGAI